ncbi:MAG: hypothetical protein ACOCYQ_02955 [Alkalispirochaeta sp.]
MNLPEIDGLEVVTGLRYLQGNRNALRWLPQRFPERHGEDTTALRGAVAAAEDFVFAMVETIAARRLEALRGTPRG